MTPKVSICIPTFMQTEFLKRTLDSIYFQTYQDYEIVITDDSPDNTVEQLVNKYDFKGRLRYIKNSERLGSPRNWNRAIGLANGEFIKILHHDDWFADSDSLRKYVDLLAQNPNADFAFSACNNISGNVSSLWCMDQGNLLALKHDPYRLIIGNKIGAPSVTIFRNHKKLYFDENLIWLVDVDFYIQMLENNNNFINCPEALINICGDGKHQITNNCQDNKDIEIPEYMYIYKKFHKNFTINSFHKKKLYDLFLKYKIRKIKDLQALTLISEIPDFIRKIFSSISTFRIKSLLSSS